MAGEADGGVVAGEVDGRIGWQRSSLSPDSTILPQPPQVDGGRPELLRGTISPKFSFWRIVMTKQMQEEASSSVCS